MMETLKPACILNVIQGYIVYCLLSIESRDLGAFIMRIQMHKLIHIQCVIYAFMRRKIHTHLLCKFQRMLSHASSVLARPCLRPSFPLGWSVVLATANKFTSKVFICVCLAAKAKKDAHTASVYHCSCPCPCTSPCPPLLSLLCPRLGLCKYHFHFN